MNNGFFRYTHDDFSVVVPSLPRPPVEVIQADWPFVRYIERDDSPTESITMRFGTVLQRPEETWVDSEACELRLLPLRAKKKLPGFQQYAWLMVHFNDYQLPEIAQCALSFIFRAGGHIDFMGLESIDDQGRPRMLCIDSQGPYLGYAD